MRVKIPPIHEKALKKLFALEKSQVELFLQALRSAQPRANPGTFSEEVAKLAGLPEEDAVSFIRALGSLYIFYLSTGDEFNEFASEVASSFPEEEAIATSVLKDAMQAEPLCVTFKAVDLSQSYDRVWGSARIITEMRPVYSSTGGMHPKGIIIGHTLELATEHNGKTDAFYIHLSESDLKLLKHQIERAEEKQKSLRNELNEKQIKELK